MTTTLAVRQVRRAALGLAPGLLALLLLAAPPAAFQQATLPAPSAVFELELPELGVAPTSQPDIVIPTPNVDTVVLYVLRPQADQIDYGQIGTQVNGQSTGLLTEIGAGPRGKIVRINLRRYPGYGLIAGRNTVEITAHNQRGREFYASFVLRTATENRTQLRVPVRRGERETPAIFSGRKYALIVGISKFARHAGGLSDLKYADADAVAISKFLQTPAGGRFPADNILLLTNEQATLAALQ